MRVVAILASHRSHLTGFHREAVNACAVTFGLALMTLAAIHRLGRDVIVRVLGSDIGMATCAGVSLMRRSFKFSDIDEEGNLLPGTICFGERLVAMTIETGTVFDLFGYEGRTSHSQYDEDRNREDQSISPGTHNDKGLGF